MTQFIPQSPPFLLKVNKTQLVMLQVVLALIPGIIALFWYFGWGVLIQISIAIITALLAEAFVLKLRKRPIKKTLFDYSAIVTAILFAISITPLLPWWMNVIGMFFAIVIVKQLFGGLGHNPFNPAMAAYVLLLISWPMEMTQWLAPSMLASHTLTFNESMAWIFNAQLPSQYSWDALTMATPLDEMRTQLKNAFMIDEIKRSPLWGDFGGKGWEWVGNWFLLGGLFLLWRKVIDWRIPVSVLAGALITSGLFWLFDQQTHPFPAFHLFSGGLILGAFFIATDPVSASTTPKGRLIYGALIGIITIIIRSFGGYPDAIAFAVLLMNMAAPTIDYFSAPRVFGYENKG